MPIDRTDQPAGFEQIERQDLREQRGGHVEAAAIHVEIDEGRARGGRESPDVYSASSSSPYCEWVKSSQPRP